MVGPPPFYFPVHHNEPFLFWAHFIGMNAPRIFKIVVPCKPRLVKHKLIESVTYPASGFPLYTKEEAIANLKRFEARGMEAWAESEDRGRFALYTLDVYNSLYPE